MTPKMMELYIDARLPKSTEPIEIGNDRKPANDTTRKKISKMSMALAVLAEHPEWSNEQVAASVGCHPKSLSRNKQFKNVRRMVRGLGQESMRHSERSRGPDLDEYEDDIR
jgi:hypothetical protein